MPVPDKGVLRNRNLGASYNCRQQGLSPPIRPLVLTGSSKRGDQKKERRPDELTNAPLILI